ncbi:hypothetical protein [Megasphaera massiliensis]|uniref:hypothetical protein n=1 Tax=Megasphaera massiliensis TaxID=1232428 RepID=UPI0005CA5815|nr:hypothetical protein [Megasphaera massiliensis]
MKIYHDWMVLIKYYYSTLAPGERNYEIVIPLVLSIVVSSIYGSVGATLSGLLKLRDLLPATLAILIGFTIACIAVLASSEARNIKFLKRKLTNDRTINNGNIVSLFQWILTLFCYELFIQIALLLFTFFVAFIIRVFNDPILMFCLLVIEVGLLLHIVFLLIRCVTYVYLAFFPNKKTDAKPGTKNDD